MAVTLQDLEAALTQLGTDVAALKTKIDNLPAPADLTNAVSAVAAIDADVQALTAKLP